MPQCSLNSPVFKTCNFTNTGIRNNVLYFANYADVNIDSITYSGGTTGTTITSIPMVATKKFYQIAALKTPVPVPSQTIDNAKNLTQTVTFSINGYSDSLKKTYEAFALSSFVAIYQDIDGQGFVYGLDGGLELETLDYQNNDTTNGATIVLNGKASELAPQITPTGSTTVSQFITALL